MGSPQQPKYAHQRLPVGMRSSCSCSCLILLLVALLPPGCPRPCSLGCCLGFQPVALGGHIGPRRNAVGTDRRADRQLEKRCLRPRSGCMGQSVFRCLSAASSTQKRACETKEKLDKREPKHHAHTAVASQYAVHHAPTGREGVLGGGAQTHRDTQKHTNSPAPCTGRMRKPRTAKCPSSFEGSGQVSVLASVVERPTKCQRWFVPLMQLRAPATYRAEQGHRDPETHTDIFMCATIWMTIGIYK